MYGRYGRVRSGMLPCCFTAVLTSHTQAYTGLHKVMTSLLRVIEPPLEIWIRSDRDLTWCPRLAPNATREAVAVPV